MPVVPKRHTLVDRGARSYRAAPSAFLGPRAFYAGPPSPSFFSSSFVMYWPTGSARRLSVESLGFADVHTEAVHISCARDGLLWLVLTRSALLIWRTRPAELVTAMVRTARSIHEYGANVGALWRHDSGAVVVRTERDTLLFYDLVQPTNMPAVHALSDTAAPDLVPPAHALLRTFQPATGDAYHTVGSDPFGGRIALQLMFRDALQVDPGISAMAGIDTEIFVATRSPAAVQLVPWPSAPDEKAPAPPAPPVLLTSLPWLTPSPLVHAEHSYATDLSTWLTEDGCAYIVGHTDDWVGARAYSASEEEAMPVMTAVNARFSLLAVGLDQGDIVVFEFHTSAQSPEKTHTFSLTPHATGRVTTLAWTADGHVLAVGYERGWAVWSMFGHIITHSFRNDWDSMTRVYRDTFQFGTQSVFWALGGTELFVLPRVPPTDAPVRDDDKTLVYILPFLKAASTAQLMPAETDGCFLLGDTGAYIYRGNEQSDAGLLTPDNDIWRHVPFPSEYLTMQWPIRYAVQSSDGRFLAIAGRRGLSHYSTVSGHWKMYEVASQALSFCVRGGMVWFQHVLIAACDCMGEIQIRLYSRDQPLDNAHLLDLVVLHAPVVTMQLLDMSLLLYLADNTLVHYNIATTREHVRLILCGSISFEGIIGEPSRVRAFSWLLPDQSEPLGTDDLTIATLVFLIDGMLVLLRPARTSDDDQLSYDLQVLHEHIESYWTPIYAYEALQQSLWSFDGQRVLVWLNLLQHSDAPDYVFSVDDTYPLCILTDRGIILGADSQAVVRRTLDTTAYRLRLSTTLFLDRILRALLQRRRVSEAIHSAAPYVPLEYFAHVLEVLVHDILEKEADESTSASLEDNAPLLPTVLAFLDHYNVALQVIVRAARKTEVSRWAYLFDAAGRPSALMQRCLDRGDYASAGAYLLVVHEMEDRPTSIQATATALAHFEENEEWEILRHALSFLNGVDQSGETLRTCAALAAKLVHGISLLSTENDLEGAQDVPLLRTPLNHTQSSRKYSLNETPRRPSSLARKNSLSSMPLSPVPNSPALRASSAHVLHRAARSASITLSPSMPRMQANGRLVLPVSPSPGPLPPKPS